MTINADEAVAEGAALFAAKYYSHDAQQLDSLRVNDVSSHELRVNDQQVFPRLVTDSPRIIPMRLKDNKAGDDYEATVEELSYANEKVLLH